MLFLAAEAYKFDLFHVKSIYYAADKCRKEFRSDWLNINSVEPSVAAQKEFERRIIRPCFGSGVPTGMIRDILFVYDLEQIYTCSILAIAYCEWMSQPDEVLKATKLAPATMHNFFHFDFRICTQIICILPNHYLRGQILGWMKGIEKGFHVSLNFGKLRQINILLKQLSSTVQVVSTGVYYQLMLVIEALYFIAYEVFYNVKDTMDYCTLALLACHLMATWCLVNDFELAKYHADEKEKYQQKLNTYKTKKEKYDQKVQQRQNQNDENENIKELQPPVCVYI